MSKIKLPTRMTRMSQCPLTEKQKTWFYDILDVMEGAHSNLPKSTEHTQYSLLSVLPEPESDVGVDLGGSSTTVSPRACSGTRPAARRSHCTAIKTVLSEVPVVEVYSNDAAAVAAAFKEHKIDLVIATLGAAATAAQKPLVDAAKLTGVKLFVPSEYGFATDGSADGDAAEIRRDPFDQDIHWNFRWKHPVDSKIKSVGKGNTPVSVTSIPDITGFVAHVLTTAPPSELEDLILRLEGD
ncbi:hypothetical protein B0H14DRAFT_3457367 [Mycena olivaceomarginata]|nr:hypothetical protein B0H14DRAFT_3457367 [Mycena olivaceomarginata]